jgi:hypothetical protein
MSCRLKPSTVKADSGARFRAGGFGVAGGAVCLSSSREEEDAVSESWALRCRLRVDCGHSTQPDCGDSAVRGGMDRQASGTSPPVETMPVLLRRVRFHLSDDRLTTAPRPAARLVRLRDLKPPELGMAWTRPPEHPPSLDSEDGRARRCAHLRCTARTRNRREILTELSGN